MRASLPWVWGNRSVLWSIQILALVAVRKAMDYLFSQHDLSFLDDVIPEKDKKKKEDEKKKKKKKGSIDSDIDDVRNLYWKQLIYLLYNMC